MRLRKSINIKLVNKMKNRKEETKFLFLKIKKLNKNKMIIIQKT